MKTDKRDALILARLLDETQRRNMTRPQFARYYLMRLGIGDDLQRVALDPKHPHRLASMDEVQVLFPELQYLRQK